MKNVSWTKKVNSRIVEMGVLAVRRFARRAAAEVAGGNALAVALMRQQLDEPGLVLDLFVQDTRGHIVGARIFAEGQIADLDPAADGAALGFKQQRQDIDHGRRI